MSSSIWCYLIIIQPERKLGMISIYLYYPLHNGRGFCGFSECWEESPVEPGWPIMHKWTLILINKECHCPYGALFSFVKINKQTALCGLNFVESCRSPAQLLLPHGAASCSPDTLCSPDPSLCRRQVPCFSSPSSKDTTSELIPSTPHHGCTCPLYSGPLPFTFFSI